MTSARPYSAYGEMLGLENVRPRTMRLKGGSDQHLGCLKSFSDGPKSSFVRYTLQNSQKASKNPWEKLENTFKSSKNQSNDFGPI